jgi:transcriptional regulator with XRE-family HTH domain
VNTDHHPNRPIDPKAWDRYEMRTVLARRDIGGAFKLLQKLGVSQRRIAALTGQSQSEISEIIAGRQVMAYEVLARICDGLKIPRGYMGLSYDPATAAIAEDGLTVAVPVEEQPQQMLGRAAQVAIGAVQLDPGTWWQPFERSTAPVPDHVGASDVERLERMTAMFRAMDNQFGGGGCRDAVVAQVQTAQRMLRSSIADDVQGRLFTALADLHCVAGWSSFDVGMYVPARLHYGRALEQARYAAQPSLVAKALYCTGRLQLYQGRNEEALRLFQLGQISALESRSGLALTLLAANEAWAHAALGDTHQALGALGRAKAAFGSVDSGDAVVPPWLGFVDTAELQSLVALTHAELPAPTSQQRHTALEGLYVAIGLRDSDTNRSKALETIAMVEALRASGDKDAAETMQAEAERLAAEVRSERVSSGLARLVGVAA